LHRRDAGPDQNEDAGDEEHHRGDAPGAEPERSELRIESEFRKETDAERDADADT